LEQAVEEQITFDAGETTLEGALWLPPEPNRAAVILCHPHPLFGGNMQNNVVTALAQAFQQAGLATVRFNFRGVGNSGGTHGGGEAEMSDVDAAITNLLSRYSPSKLIVTGYSFGAMVGLRVGTEDSRVHALIGVGTPVEHVDPAALSTADKPILLVSGDSDHVSPLDGLQSLFDELPEPKQLVSLAGVDHFFAGCEHKATEAALEFIAAL
jgi:hypothetical protein